MTVTRRRVASLPSVVVGLTSATGGVGGWRRHHETNVVRSVRRTYASGLPLRTRGQCWYVFASADCSRSWARSWSPVSR